MPGYNLSISLLAVAVSLLTVTVDSFLTFSAVASTPTLSVEGRYPCCIRSGTTVLKISSTEGNQEPANLNGKVAVVTGASRGIGKGVALSLGQQGYTVYVTGRSSGGTTTNEVTDIVMLCGTCCIYIIPVFQFLLTS